MKGPSGRSQTTSIARFLYLPSIFSCLFHFLFAMTLFPLPYHDVDLSQSVYFKLLDSSPFIFLNTFAQKHTGIPLCFIGILRIIKDTDPIIASAGTTCLLLSISLHFLISRRIWFFSTCFATVIVHWAGFIYFVVDQIHHLSLPL